MINFVIPGTPVPKGRPRMRKGGITYTPKKTADYEALVRDVFNVKVKKDLPDPLTGPVRLKITFFYAFPKSYSKKKREEIRDRGWKKTTKPDLDNLVKSVTDGLNGLAYVDDNQITEIIAEKRYSGSGLEGAEVTIQEGEASYV